MYMFIFIFFFSYFIVLPVIVNKDFHIEKPLSSHTQQEAQLLLGKADRTPVSEGQQNVPLFAGKRWVGSRKIK